MRDDRNFRFRSAEFRFCFGFIEQAQLFFRVHDFLDFRLAAELGLAQPFNLLHQESSATAAVLFQSVCRGEENRRPARAGP